MKVLIVDDSKMNIKVAEDALREYDVVNDITTSMSGEKALEILDAEKVDLILLDIVMPGITGVDLLKILKKQKRFLHTKVIMMTTVDDFLVLKECFDLGAVDYINKPFNKIEFTARVKSVLAQIQNEHKLVRALELMEKQNKELLRVNQMLNETQGFLIEKEKMIAIGSLVEGLMGEVTHPMAEIENELNRVVHKVNDLSEASCGDALIHVKSNLKDDLTNMAFNLAKMRQVIHAFDHFSKDHKKEHRVPSRISDLIEDVLVLLSGELKNVKKIEKKYGDPSMLVCNQGLVKKALMHIIMNSIEALREVEDSKISIKTIENESHILCVVSDNGGGIPDSLQSSVFDPFVSTKDKNAHLGMGLSVVHDVVVSRHDGQIDLESHLDKGCTITLIFEKKIKI